MPGPSSSLFSRENTLTSTTIPRSPCGTRRLESRTSHAFFPQNRRKTNSRPIAVRHAQARVSNLARLLTEDGTQQALLSGQLGLALGRDLADQDVALLDLGADVDDVALVEVAQRVVGNVGDVAGDLFGAELRLAGLGLVLLDVDRGVHVLLDHALREKDRVFEVVALPGHGCDEHVAAQSHLAVVDRRPVGEDVALLDVLARFDLGAVVEAGALV